MVRAGIERPYTATRRYLAARGVRHLSRTGVADAPAQADPQAGARAAGGRRCHRRCRAFPPARGPDLDRRAAAPAGYEPEPAAAPALLRAGLALRGRGSGVHVPESVDRERVRRAAAGRARPDPALRGHTLVPWPGRRRGGARPRPARWK